MLFINIFFVVKLVIDRVLNFCSHSELNFLNRLQERVEQLAGLLFLDNAKHFSRSIENI